MSQECGTLFYATVFEKAGVVTVLEGECVKREGKTCEVCFDVLEFGL